jgi:hypothetical protein
VFFTINSAILYACRHLTTQASFVAMAFHIKQKAFQISEPVNLILSEAHTLILAG